MFDEWRLKICDFGTSSLYEHHSHDWWAAEIRYTVPEPEAHIPLRKDIQVDTIHREIFALGSAIYDITEWKVPYGSEYDVPCEDVEQMLMSGKWPEISSGNPAEDIILQCWAFKYESARQVVQDLKNQLEASS